MYNKRPTSFYKDEYGRGEKGGFFLLFGGLFLERTLFWNKFYTRVQKK